MQITVEVTERQEKALLAFGRAYPGDDDAAVAVLFDHALSAAVKSATLTTGVATDLDGAKKELDKLRAHVEVLEDKVRAEHARSLSLEKNLQATRRKYNTLLQKLKLE